MSESKKAIRPVYEDSLEAETSPAHETPSQDATSQDANTSAVSSPTNRSVEVERQAQARSSLKRLVLLSLLAVAGLAGFGSSQDWFGWFDSTVEISGESVEGLSPRKTIAETYASRDLRYRELPPLVPLRPQSGDEVISECLKVAEHLASWLENVPDAQEMRARAEFEFGDTDVAKQIWQQLLEVNPDYAYALKGLGDIAKLEGDLEAAVEYFGQNFRAQPADLSRKFSYASALSTLGNYEEAVQLLEEIVQERPNDADAFFELGTVYKQLQEWEAAEEALESALDLNDRLNQAYLSLAQVKTKLGKRTEAREYQKQFRERAAPPDLDDPQAEYDDLKALQIDVGALYADMAKVYISAGDMKSGRLLLLRAQRMDPTAVEPCQALAWLAKNNERPLEAIRWLQKLDEIDPGQLSYCMEIAGLYLTNQRTEDALSTIQQFVDEYPDRADGMMALSQFQLDAGLVNQALESAKNATSIEPNLTTYTWVATVAEQIGDTESEVQALREAISLVPEAEQLKRRLELLSGTNQGESDNGGPTTSGAQEEETAEVDLEETKN